MGASESAPGTPWGPISPWVLLCVHVGGQLLFSGPPDTEDCDEVRPAWSCCQACMVLLSLRVCPHGVTHSSALSYPLVLVAAPLVLNFVLGLGVKSCAQICWAQDNLLGFATNVPLHGDMCLSLHLADHRAEWDMPAAVFTHHAAFLSPGVLRVTAAELDVNPHG